MKSAFATTNKPSRLVAALIAASLLTACEDGPKMSFLQPSSTATKPATNSTSTKLVERDIEAPEVFHATEAGLWDGRPSLGGIWVAHPDVKEPERVLIRNTTNGKFVIGALFRRERDIPGPRLQASSDAASALGMLAGAPVQLDVTALRRETVEEPGPEVGEQVAALTETGSIDEATLDPIAGAAAAIDAPAPKTAPKSKPKPAAMAKPISSSLDKPYVQIGIFSVENNASRTAAQMRNAGMVPTVFMEDLNNKTFWRVVVGPAQNKSERSAILKEVKAAGFSDAYVVAN